MPVMSATSSIPNSDGPGRGGGFVLLFILYEQVIVTATGNSEQRAASDSDSNKGRPQVVLVSIYIIIIRNIYANKAFLPCGQHIYTSKVATVTGCSKALSASCALSCTMHHDTTRKTSTDSTIRTGLWVNVVAKRSNSNRQRGHFVWDLTTLPSRCVNMNKHKTTLRNQNRLGVVIFIFGTATKLRKRVNFRMKYD